MSKINANGINNYDSIGAAREADASRAGRNSSAAIENKSAVRSEDKIQLSGEAAKIGKLVETIKDLPDVRQEKVDALREKIEAGEYNPSSVDIADAMLKSQA